MSYGFDVTLLFAKAFPPAKMPVIITVTKFDLWAAKHQLYRHPDGTVIAATETAAINQVRSQLRNTINENAWGEPWRTAGQLPFHVHVNNHGIDYRMCDPETAHNTKTEQLPEKMGGKLNAQIRTLNKLEGAIDMTKLTEDDRIKFGAYKRAMARALKRVVSDLEDLTDDLEGIVAHQEAAPAADQMSDNQQVTKKELAKIRRLGDFELIMLISEIHDHGWTVARKTLLLMPEQQ